MNLRKGGYIVLLVAIGMSLATVAAGYEITASDTTPVPERTVDLQGNTYTITETVRVSPGESFSVDVDAPNESYRVYLYNSDREIVDQQRGEGAEEFSFDTSGFDPGSYIVSANSDGDHEAIHPVVVSGHDVGVDAPESPAADESFEVTVDVTQTAADSAPESVTAVFEDDDGDVERFEATGGDGEYTATIDAGELDAGDYDVYGIAQNDEQVAGSDRNEIVGLSDPGSLSVTESTATATQTATPTATESDGDGGDTGGGDGGDASGGDDDTPTDTATPTETDSSAADEDNSSADNETATAEPTETETATPTTDATTDDGTETMTDATTTAPADEPAETTAAPTTETDDGSMITPDGGTETTESTAADGPGFTVAGALLALVVLFVLRR